MCSIAGAETEKDVQRMLTLMKHRAPDDEGIRDIGGFHLGMGRLAIIDTISPGLCPFERNGSVLVFNGELYNYRELREELKKLGHEFTTESDTEVLFEAFSEWGTDCLQRCNWMGAFAIAQGARLTLARDLAGEKPLYYRERPFAFASEAKALGFDCAEFPPAHYGTYDVGTGAFELRRWWSLPTGNFEGTFEEAVEHLDAILGDSVRLRTRADVPYGLYYSGGIDSTLISTYHDFEHTFSYTDGDYRDEFLDTFPKILWHLDYPIDSFSPFGLWKLAEEASKKVKVVLSGEGADEIFGGYVRYVPNEFNRQAQRRFPSYTALFPWRDMLGDEFVGNMRELLRMGDRMSAAFGLENRCPFLDRRVVDFAASLPMEWKINGFDTKVILRELLRRRKPDYVFEEKQGLFVSANAYLGETDKFSKKTYREYQKKLWKNIVK